MDTPRLVVAFSDSRAVRETLTVLLEQDCALRFMNAEDMPPPDSMLADLAVVAMHRGTGLLHELIRRWPTLPIVAVELPGSGPASTPPPAGISTVPLDPHAIRGAVLQTFSHAADVPLAATVRSITEALRAEVASTLATLRSCASVWARGNEADARAMVPLARQHSAAITDAIGDLERFRLRPRAVQTAPHFALHLYRDLQRCDDALAVVGETVEQPSPVTGPVSLIPLLVTFLHAHVGHRSGAPIVRVGADADGVVLRYSPRSAPSSGSPPSWPLMLADLLLRPWGWRVVTTAGEDEASVRLRPA